MPVQKTWGGFSGAYSYFMTGLISAIFFPQVPCKLSPLHTKYNTHGCWNFWQQLSTHLFYPSPSFVLYAFVDIFGVFHTNLYNYMDWCSKSSYLQVIFSYLQLFFDFEHFEHLLVRT